MKYIAKQKRRQSLAARVMRREKREIRLMHERAVLNNFDLNSKNVEMYNEMMDPEFKADELNSDQKKTFALCQKFVMLGEYQNLRELESERNKVRREMDTAYNTVDYEELRRKLKRLNKEYDEYKTKLNSTEEGRRNFRLCVALENLE
jgi:hypothetical protein